MSRENWRNLIHKNKTYLPAFRYCPLCGTQLTYTKTFPPRPKCENCGFIQYVNPTVGVAVIILQNNKILLGKRCKEPFKDHWCIPCGHVEWGEDVREAAKREFKEETGLEVEIEKVFDVHSNFHHPLKLTVGIWFWGRIVGGKLQAGDDLSEVDFFDIYNLPQPMAFPTDIIVIENIKNRRGEGCHEDAFSRRVGG
ncbi:conserved hypothetical protein [Thermosulfidibacter takaii ABI70S6]|uniref:Nudix hydrolase domain-containing protein n=1 Tax=Thermosulfidibacter takaii (strain DSM 17441 / JCM 13301 / NBRC 103674 / ABI70S6) TaxID=1298851 RepID=A0A0S3QRL5_THET7|nr:NUDIX hydrolase [Thermosulfidibacter takaii]BAT70978.1 conserved hypothetical protein [Thermosulfidibacter takaii ABI70S6]